MKKLKIHGDTHEQFINAGYRERFAMEHGNASVVYINGHKCKKYTYSKYNEYQDANGAIYDTVTKEWIS